jgi:hypothetical protein
MCIAGIGLAAINTMTLEPFAQESSTDETTLSSRDLNIEYAKTNLQLARVELQQAEEFNREVAKSVSSLVTVGADVRARMLRSKQFSQATIERLKSNVKVADEQLRQAERASTGGTERVLLRHAQEKLRVAKIRLEATVARPLQNDPLSNLEVEHARLECELARLQLLMLKNPDYLLSTVENLYLKTEQLSEALIGLEQRIADLEDKSHHHL